jgi:hypothetical protein
VSPVPVACLRATHRQANSVNIIITIFNSVKSVVKKSYLVKKLFLKKIQYVETPDKNLNFFEK